MTILTAQAPAKTFGLKRQERGPDTDARAGSVLAAEGWSSIPEQRNCRFAAVFTCTKTVCPTYPQAPFQFPSKILSSVPKLYFQTIQEQKAFLKHAKAFRPQLLGKNSLLTVVMNSIYLAKRKFEIP